MRKAEVFELIVKAFGVYLLVLAIIALAAVLQSAIMLVFSLAQGSLAGADSIMAELVSAYKTTYVSAGLGAVIRCVIYTVASVNLLRSGSWVKRLMRTRASTEPTDGEASSESVRSETLPS